VIRSISPRRAAVTVDTVSATFSETMDPATVNVSTIQLFAAGVDGKPGTADILACCQGTFYAIDHKGVIRYKWLTTPGEKVLDAALNKLIEEAEKASKKKPK
jgi:hypothetical protein